MTPEAKAAKHARSVARRRDSGYARDRAAYAAMSPEQKAARLKQCRAWNAANPEKRAKLKRYTKDERAAYMREWRKDPENKLKDAACSRLWAERNKHKVASYSAARRAAILKATPAWQTPDDLWLIDEIYELCALRTKLTGVDHDVDHIYPLKGRTGCGLHVPTNLRVIPSRLNNRKFNKAPDELARLVI